MLEMIAHKEGDPSFLHACAVEPSYKLHHGLRTKPAKKTIILDPSFTANIPVADDLPPRPPFSEGLDLALYSITCSQLHAVTHNKEKVTSSSQAVMALLQTTMECFFQCTL